VTPVVYLNGAFVSESQAWVSTSDGGWLHGAGLFETMRAENGRVFRLESHMVRLQYSAVRLLHSIERKDLPSPGDLAELLNRNELVDARIRMTVSAGPVRLEGESHEGRPTVCVTASALLPYPARLYEAGIRVAVCDFRQSADDPIAGHKTTSYLSRLLGLRQAQAAGCMEAVWFTTRNHLAEGSISNVFVVSKGGLATPPLDTPVLPGITRSVVLELAAGLGIETREAALSIGDLLDADEVFLTNTIMQVMPVIRIEKKDIGRGQVGPLTRRLREEYRNIVQRECDR